MRTELKEGLLRGAATVLLLSAVFWSAGQTAILVNEDQAESAEDTFCVVIDAGHGGVAGQPVFSVWKCMPGGIGVQ